MTVTETEESAAVAVAAEHQARQRLIRSTQISAAITAFRALDTDHPIGSWIAGIGQRIYVLLSVAQELVASESGDYVRRALAAQGITANLANINARNFAGIASDGRDLESLLAGAAIRTSAHLTHGDTPAASMQAGEAWLRMVAETQIADAARAADSVAITTADARLAKIRVALATTTLSPEREADIARRLQAGSVDKAVRDAQAPAAAVPRQGQGKKVSIGYVRMLNLPSCGRCAVLAGRWYRWNAGFERHPMCDCRQIPAPEADSDDITMNAYAYFNSLSEADQNEYFGGPQAQAIRDGSDINQVVNASRAGSIFTADDGRRYTSEGTTRRGNAGRKRKKNGPPVLRPTVWQIYHDSRGDRNAARQQLTNFGYILS